MGKSPFSAIERLANSYTLLDKRRYAISAATFVICILVMLLVFGIVTLAGEHVHLEGYLWGLLVSVLLATAVHLIKWLDDTNDLAKMHRYPDHTPVDPAPYAHPTGQ